MGICNLVFVQHKPRWRPFLLCLILILLGFGCAAPRAITHSGMVTPKGNVKAGGDLVVNYSSETASRLLKLSSGAVRELSQRDSVYLNEEIDNISAALISYALDPTGASYDLYLRYGLLNRIDAGYKYASGAHAFDAMYQFLGPAGVSGEADATVPNQWYGSIGLQYSWQKSELPGKKYLDEFFPILDFRAERKDFLVPLVFSYSFGPKEQYGHFGFGAVYQRSSVTYVLEPGRLYQANPDLNQVFKVPSLSAARSYNAFGLFINGKIGYKHVYLLPALSVYYQNFGRYPVLNNRHTELKGFTVVPSVGVQFWIGKNR